MNIKIIDVTTKTELLYSEGSVIAIVPSYEITAEVGNTIIIKHQTETNDVERIKKEIEKNLRADLKNIMND